MKSLLKAIALTLLVSACAKKSADVDVPSTKVILPGQAAHKVSGQYSTTVTVPGSPSTINGGTHSIEYDESSPGNYTGHMNMSGLQSGFTAIQGTKVGNVFSYSSKECAGDSFQGSMNIASGAGSFAGTVCGVSYSNGSVNGAHQDY